MKNGPVIASYLLTALAVFLVLRFHLLAAVFAGLAVHVLTVKLARRLPVGGGWQHRIALAAIAVFVILALTGAILGIASFFRGNGGVAALLATAAETLEKLRRVLPPSVADTLPTTVDDVRIHLAGVLRENAKRVSAAGIAGFRTVAHIIIGMVIGGMIALHHYQGVDLWPPLARSLYRRVIGLRGAFEKVVFAQVKISVLNTILTALYLLVILPLFGVHMPLVSVLIPLTFVAGLLPIVGNLISNTAVVTISLGVSPAVGLASVIFLIIIHKLEYFTNAKIIGGHVQARAWELLCAMLVMDAVFGLAGLIAAPVVYVWLKSELQEKGLV